MRILIGVIGIVMGTSSLALADSDFPHQDVISCVSQKYLEGKSTLKLERITNGCEPGSIANPDQPYTKRACYRIGTETESADGMSGSSMQLPGYCNLYNYDPSAENKMDEERREMVCHASIGTLALTVIVEDSGRFTMATMTPRRAGDDEFVSTDHGLCLID